MASGKASDIRVQRGQLYLGATTVIGAAPYGGTVLGQFRNLVFRPGLKTAQIKALEFGNIVYDEAQIPGNGYLGGVLLSVDDDTINALPGGDSGNLEFAVAPGDGDNHRLATPVSLLVVPEAVDDDFWLYLPRALMMRDEMHEISSEGILEKHYQIAPIVARATPGTDALTSGGGSHIVYRHRLRADF